MGPLAGLFHWQMQIRGSAAGISAAKQPLAQRQRSTATRLAGACCREPDPKPLRRGPGRPAPPSPNRPLSVLSPDRTTSESHHLGMCLGASGHLGISHLIPSSGDLWRLTQRCTSCGRYLEFQARLIYEIPSLFPIPYRHPSSRPKVQTPKISPSSRGTTPASICRHPQPPAGTRSIQCQIPPLALWTKITSSASARRWAVRSGGRGRGLCLKPCDKIGPIVEGPWRLLEGSCSSSFNGRQLHPPNGQDELVGSLAPGTTVPPRLMRFSARSRRRDSVHLGSTAVHTATRVTRILATIFPASVVAVRLSVGSSLPSRSSRCQHDHPALRSNWAFRYSVISLCLLRAQPILLVSGLRLRRDGLQHPSQGMGLRHGTWPQRPNSLMRTICS